MSDDLNRRLAPITPAAWAAIDDEARRALTVHLAARKLVDFTGPLGWTVSAVSQGRTQPMDLGPGDVQARLRDVLTLVELRVPFRVSRDALANIDRGSPSPELGAVAAAARSIAAAEDRLVFDGHGDAGIWGVGGVDREPVQLGPDVADLQAGFAEAVGALRSRGVEGPYAAAVGPALHQRLMGTASGGRPAINLVEKALGGGSVVWAPTLGDTALVLSRRGGDFELIVGRDLSIGYEGHSASAVSLYLEESLTFRALDADAAVRLVAV